MNSSDKGYGIISSENSIKNNFTLNETTLSTSNLVYKLLENGFILEESNIFYKQLLNKTVKIYSHFLKKEKHNPLFSNYHTDEGFNDLKIETKIDKNFSIFLPFLISSIQKKIEEENLLIDNNQVFKIIHIYIKKFYLINYIFGDKLNFNSLPELLKLDISNLSNMKNDLCNNSLILDKQEEEINNLFIYNKEIPCTNLYLSSIYKISNKKAYENLYSGTHKKSELGREKLDLLLSENIENEVQLLFMKSYNLFLKTISISDNIELRLNKLNQAFNKILGFTSILRKNNIAFLNINRDLNDEGFIDEIISYFFNKKFNINDSKNLIFISYLRSNILRGIGDFNNIEKQIEIYKDNEKKKNIHKLNINDSKQKSFSDLTFNEWQKLALKERYGLFFKNCLISDSNGILKIGAILKFKAQNKKTLVNLFSEIYGINNLDVINQMSRIEKLINKGINLEYFIKNDINNLEFLIKWWRFILKLRIGRKTKKSSSKGKIYKANYYKKIEEIPNGLIEMIDIKLDKEGLLNSPKLNYNPSGRVHNLSTENVGYRLEYLFKTASKGAINLANYKISGLLLSTEKELYIGNKKQTKEDLYDYINLGTSTCISILQGKTIFTENENNYIKILKYKKIIPTDLTELSLRDKNNLTKLIEGLKVIKSKIILLEKMLRISENDSLEVYEIFKDLLGNDNDYNIQTASGIGPNKELSRAFVKLIKNYNGEFHKLGDLTRLRIKNDSIIGLTNTFIKFIKIASNNDNIVNIGVEDWTGSPLSEPKKNSGYRDLKAVFTLKSGNVIEFQFHYTKMLEVKTIGIHIGKGMKNKLKDRGILFSNDELKEFSFQFTKITGKTIDYETSNVLSNSISCFSSTNNKVKISGDLIYDIRRDLNNNPSLVLKLTKLERVLFEQSWTEIVLEFIKNYVKK